MKCPTKQQDSRQQDERCENADERPKCIEKMGRKHRTDPSSLTKHRRDPSSLTKATNALTVQAITKLVIVQQGSNHTHPC